MTEDRDNPRLDEHGVDWMYGSDTYGAAATERQAAFATDWLEEQSQHPFIRETGARALRALDLQPGAHVLEVGCGTGVFLPALAAAVGPRGRIVGVDHAPALLSRARQRIAAHELTTPIDLIEGDAHALPFATGTFDAAHCERVLMHLENPGVAIREMVRVVKPGGRVVAAEIAARLAGINHPDHEMAEWLSRLQASAVRNGWIGLELRREFGEAGLVETKAEAVMDVEDVLDADEAAELRRLARSLPDDQDRARAITVAGDLVDHSSRGMHTGYAVMFIARGTVPRADEAG